MMVDHISVGILPWDTDGVKAALAQYKSYHTATPNGYTL
jgi:hypothetical protein